MLLCGALSGGDDVFGTAEVIDDEVSIFPYCVRGSLPRPAILAVVGVLLPQMGADCICGNEPAVCERNMFVSGHGLSRAVACAV